MLFPRKAWMLLSYFLNLVQSKSAPSWLQNPSLPQPIGCFLPVPTADSLINRQKVLSNYHLILDAALETH